MAEPSTNGASAALAVAVDSNDVDSDDGNGEVKVQESVQSDQETRNSSSSNRGIPYRDHYSLQYPSSTVRFRSSATSHRVYEGNNSQIILEERNGEITVKRTTDTTSGTLFLRACYTIVAVLWSGFLFVFCTQLLIFLIMDLTVYLGGTTGSEVAVERAIGTLLSIPLFVTSLASAMIIACHFISDTWNGQYLLKKLVFGGVLSVKTAWITFGFFLGFPLLVMGICLLAGRPNWWSITAIFWFSGVSVFYVLFAFVVIFFEIHACLEIVSNEYGFQHEKWKLVQMCILLRQIKTLSGETSRVFLARGALHNANSARDPIVEEPVQYHESLYCRFTKWSFLHKIGMFTTLQAPGQRIYPIEETQGVRPFVTYTTWSLEKLYCRPRNSWFVAVIQGPAALTKAQMQSSFACSIVGSFLVVFLVVAFLVFFQFSGAIISLVVVVMVLFSIPTFIATCRIYNMVKDIVGLTMNDNENPSQTGQEGAMVETEGETEDSDIFMEASELGLSGVGDSEGVFQVCEAYRITQPSNRFCWVVFLLELGLFFVWPLVSIFVAKNSAIAVVFLCLGLFSIPRYYMNPSVVLREIGNMRHLLGKNEHDKWKNRSRTSDIISNITRSRSRGPWIIVMSFFLFIAALLGVGALMQDDPQQSEGGYNVTFVSDTFRYERLNNTLPYPTCSLDFNNVGGPSGGVLALSDFAFLSLLAYETNSTKLQEHLDVWFGGGTAIDSPELVEEFRTQTNRQTSPVTYKLYSFVNVTSSGQPIAVVGVRGSQNGYDWLTNAALWSAAYGMQILRSFLPFGFIWNPIFDELVKAVSIVESTSIKRVSYYKETSDFVRWLQSSGIYADVKISGHSLGGGLSIITAAQTKVSGIAISGPNAMMLRKALEPPVSEEALDTYTFNVIPDRDMVPTAGGVAKAYENIQCRSAPNDPSGCHDVLRSLCEILFTCGTDNRPVMCQCVAEYGYPEPISSNGESFAEACGI